MQKKIKCPFCTESIESESEKCKYCENEMPWMPHVYRRETSIYRGSKNFIKDIISSITNKTPPDISKITGLVNSLLVGRFTIIIGSLIGIFLLLIELNILSGQKEIMTTQTKLMEQQNNLFRVQNTTIEFEQYKQIRSLFADTSFFKKEKRSLFDYESDQRIKLSVPLNESVIKWVKLKATENPANYSRILYSLLSDSDHRVRAGSMVALFDLIKNTHDSIHLYSNNPINVEIAFVDFGNIPFEIKNSRSIKTIRISACDLNSLSIENSSISRLSLTGFGNVEEGSFMNSKIGTLSISNFYIRDFQINGMEIDNFINRIDQYKNLNQFKRQNEVSQFKNNWIKNPHNRLEKLPQFGPHPKNQAYDSTYFYYNKSVIERIDLNGDGMVDTFEQDSLKIEPLLWRKKYKEYIQKHFNNQLD